jgi:4Fe-4S ferredoxin
VTALTEPNACKQDAGKFQPVIDRNLCEGKAECVRICPVDVFALGILPQNQRSDLSLKGRVKGFIHGWKQALLANPNACEACGLCLKACPENAIRLIKI